MVKRCVSLLLLVGGGCVHAQHIDKVTVTPNPALVGEEVKVTVSAGFEPPTTCGLGMHFGEADDLRKIKIDSKYEQFPVTRTRIYSTPGVYRIVAEGRKVTSHLPCIGKAEATLTVKAAQVTSAPTPGAVVTSPSSTDSSLRRERESLVPPTNLPSKKADSSASSRPPKQPAKLSPPLPSAPNAAQSQRPPPTPELHQPKRSSVDDL